MKRNAATLLLILILFAVFSVTVFANSPGPAQSIEVEVQNLPDNAVYCDLLISIKETDTEYTDWNSENGKKYGISEQSEIVKYCKDGYRSFTFHYKDAESDIRLTGDSGNSENDGEKKRYAGFAFDSYDVESDCKTQFEVLKEKYPDAYFVLLDQGGNVIVRSQIFSVSDPENGYLIGYLFYNAKSGKVDLNYYTNWFTSPSFLIVLLIMGMSILIEVIIAALFRLKNLQKIVVVNLITQILMKSFITLGLFPYWKAVILAEIFIYIGEFITYRLIFKEEKTSKLLFYTVAANTASLLAGLLFIFFFKYI